MRGPSSSAAERAAHEVQHGRQILDQAECIWGWDTPAGRLRAERRAQLLIRHAELQGGRSCLEVGCGTGLFTAMLARSGAQVEAVDISPDLLGKARQREGCERVTFRLGNAETGENLEGPYDAIVGVSVLHHLDCSRTLPSLVGHLRPGGRFVFTEPNRRNPQIWLERNVSWLKPLLGVSPDETAFLSQEMRNILELHGLTAVQVTPFDWLHPWTPPFLIPAVKALGSLLEATPGLREFSGSLLIVAKKP